VSRIGFTGHEDEDDLGLVNMRGRIYDPKLGRFLQTDPIVSTPASGQSWNPYSYVHNSPLNFTDPSGFVDVPALDGYDTDPDVQRIIATGCHGKECLQKPGPSTPTAKASDAERDDMPAGAPPATVASPLGPGSTDPLPTVTVAADPNEWRQSAPARAAHEFARGVLGGLAPLGVNFDALATWTGILPRGTRNEQIVRQLGQAAGGFLQASVGLFVAGHGAGMFAVSGGSSGVVSAPEIAAGVTLAVAGVANLAQAMQALMSTGSGSKGTAGGPRAGMRFTRKDKRNVIEENRANNDGTTRCTNCGTDTLPAQQGRAGVTPPVEETNVDHIHPRAKGGDGSPGNAQVLCRGCNMEKGDTVP
jgi:RHS repeat-associated protein